MGNRTTRFKRGGEPRLILLNKPYRTLSQFTDQGGRATLATLDLPKGVYPAGRLDYDSEGLLVLTNHGPWQARISHPRHKMIKTYWVQVEGEPDEEALQRLHQGVRLKDGPARARGVRLIDEPSGLWPRHPPIRHRLHVPTHWLEIHLEEGRNRQVRRMTAAVGLPTLRLIRAQIGPWRVAGLAPGEWREAGWPRGFNADAAGRADGRYRRPRASETRRRPRHG